jgi:hypothetical protein
MPNKVHWCMMVLHGGVRPEPAGGRGTEVGVHQPLWVDQLLREAWGILEVGLGLGIPRPPSR